MKSKLITLFLVLAMLLIACAGPPGPQGPQGPEGLPGECTDAQCEVPEGIITEIKVLQSGLEAVTDRVDVIEAGGGVLTEEVPVEIWCDDGPINEGSVRDVLGHVRGNEFACEFTVDNGGRIQEACLAYYCIPVDIGQPSGHAPFFIGVGRLLADAGNHYRTVDGVAEWQTIPEVFQGKWGVRIELANYDRFTGEQAVGSTLVGKRYPWTAGGGDHVQITIPIP